MGSMWSSSSLELRGVTLIILLLCFFSKSLKASIDSLAKSESLEDKCEEGLLVLEVKEDMYCRYRVPYWFCVRN